MALGGGTFVTQNKVLPGAYMNFVSATTATDALSDRGVAAMALELDWGNSEDIFTVSNTDFHKKSLEIFGYKYDHEKLKGLRDLFKNTKTLHAFRLNGTGIKASNTYAIAKYAGTRGNSLKTVIKKDVDQPDKFVVLTVLDGDIMDRQVVTSASELVSNDYVDFKKEAQLKAVAGEPLTSGSNAGVSISDHQKFLEKAESYQFNAIGAVSTDSATKELYISYCKRMRDEIGSKFQAVVYDKAADFEGVINLKNRVTDSGLSEASLVYWVTGITAGCAVNKSNLNKVYDGEFTVDVSFTQDQLATAIKSGEFIMHRVGADVRVLEDINSLVTVSEDKGEVFKDNQTIRVIDQIANDIAVLFNTKYLGVIPNDASGRVSLWTDVIKHHTALQDIRAIENFKDEDVKISEGGDKKSVVISDAITVVNSMSKLYMTVTVA